MDASLNEIVERAVSLMKHHFEMARVAIEVDSPAEPVQLVCIPNQLEQALVALFVNAVEAMPHGGTLTLQVETETTSKRVLMRVRDTGVGIKTEDLPHIFEPFFSTKTQGQGTGLGLSVVYGILERHGGTVEVESEIGKGTSFKLSLPRERNKGSAVSTEELELEKRL